MDFPLTRFPRDLTMSNPQIILSQEPRDPEDNASFKQSPDITSLDGLKLISETKVISRRYYYLLAYAIYS